MKTGLLPVCLGMASYKIVSRYIGGDRTGIAHNTSTVDVIHSSEKSQQYQHATLSTLASCNRLPTPDCAMCCTRPIDKLDRVSSNADMDEA